MPHQRLFNIKLKKKKIVVFINSNTIFLSGINSNTIYALSYSLMSYGNAYFFITTTATYSGPKADFGGQENTSFQVAKIDVAKSWPFRLQITAFNRPVAI